MADTTLAAPIDFSGISASSLVPNPVLAAGMDFLLRIGDTLDLLASRLGISIMYAGNGSRAVRVGNKQNLAALTLTSVGENAAPPLQTLTVGYNDVTTAVTALALGKTYDASIYSPMEISDATDPMRLVMEFPVIIAANVRSKVCTAGAAISASVGSSAANTSIDTILAARTTVNSGRHSADPRINGAPPAMFLHVIQVEHVLDSAMSHPALQYTGRGLADQQFSRPEIQENFLGLGVTKIETLDVTESGSAKQGFFIEAGGIQVAFGDVSKVPAPQDRLFMAIREAGMIMQEATGLRDQQTRAVQLYHHVGASVVDVNVARQVRILGDIS